MVMLDSVEVTMFRARRVAFMRCIGPYGSGGIGDLWRRFEAWRLAHGLVSPNGRVLGVAQDNPNITPRDLTRYDACVEVDDDFRPSDEVNVQLVRGGRFACVRFHGTVAESRAAWVRFLTRTLPEAGLVPDLAPAIGDLRGEPDHRSGDREALVRAMHAAAL
jgi:AraC family transcriptional regulator